MSYELVWLTWEIQDDEEIRVVNCQEFHSFEEAMEEFEDKKSDYLVDEVKLLLTIREYSKEE